MLVIAVMVTVFTVAFMVTPRVSITGRRRVRSIVTGIVRSNIYKYS